MSYIFEFDDDKYAVPNFLLKGAWRDESWHNDACPRFENRLLELAVWVEANEVDDREFPEWKKYTVVNLIINDDGKDMEDCSTTLGNDSVFSTDDEKVLETWLGIYDVKLGYEETFKRINSLSEPIPELADNIVSIIATADEMLERMKKW